MSALATIHVGLKQLGIVEDDARDLYERQTGKRSLREMLPADHTAVIQELRRLGFKQAANGPRKRLEGKFSKKLQALWIAGWNLGIIRDRTDKALISFVEGRTGISHVRFLRHGTDAMKAIEALKGWMTREAGVDWTIPKGCPHHRRMPGYMVARAQWSRLKALGVEMVPGTFETFVADRAVRPLDQMTAVEWAAIMNVLGERVRAAR